MMVATRRLAVFVSFMLAAAAPWPACATPAPPVPPCVPADAAVSIEALRAIVAGEGNLRLRDCAATDLAARGAPAVRTALGLLDAGDPDTVYLGLKVLSRMGSHAQAALPTLMDSIRTPPPALHPDYFPLYEAVTAIGAAAKPAIPLLIAKTRDPAHRYFALGALGRLGRYDVQRVVPHLASMLESPDVAILLDAPQVLAALREIGTPARAALPALLASLERARDIGDHRHSADVGRALAAIAPGSPAVLEQLLLEATQHGSASAAHALAHIAPLPARFAPALAAALANKPGDDYLGMALENARRVK